MNWFFSLKCPLKSGPINTFERCPNVDAMESTPDDILHVLISAYLKDIRPLLLSSKSMLGRVTRATSKMAIVPPFAHYNPTYFGNVFELTLRNLKNTTTIKSVRLLAHHNPRLTKLTIINKIGRTELVATAMLAIALPKLMIDCKYYEPLDFPFHAKFDWSQHYRIFADDNCPDANVHNRATAMTLHSNAELKGIYPNVTKLTIVGKLRSIGFNLPNVSSLRTSRFDHALQFTNITSLSSRADGFDYTITNSSQLAKLTNLRSLKWPVLSSSIPKTLTNLTRIRHLDCDSDCDNLLKLPIRDVYLTDCAHDFVVPATLTRLEVYTADIFLDWVKLPSICNLRELIMDTPSDPTTVINIGNLFSTIPTLKTISVGISTFNRQGLVGRDIQEDLGFLPQ